MLRKFLHLLGRHHWSNWSDPVPTESRGGVIAAFSGSETHGVQNRHCYVCNLYQSNIVESLSEGYAVNLQNIEELVGFDDIEEEHADF
jgi:hypothetical protein